ncbi:UDP-3-O-(3-hydroxymyristoyl)glucosamine N-acyltransferase [Cellulophaga sp. E16_2]|uniref:UDP-3-O-(3-hydroxymyristoyl)glucosamine N-acyltransferase n=1 Tax=unclassified Cellulophaga TaxID=2634405 RepID=UPI0013FD8103|nr:MULTISPECIES: UDP-3-O-(3-hydroxymyristoyl)glucosamine N-acyltransferase [unclassified Cellulophaga]MBO0593720.1 UDP-3-O-(3-hydroxymyristoyl)glucosamine N-acyltransferase [Cellulophaga sp. E16_2]
MKSYTIAEINAVINGVVLGNTSNEINAPEQLEKATIHNISFIGNRKYAKLWSSSKASVAVIDKKIALEPGENRALIQVESADLAMAQILEFFNPGMPILDEEIHPSAVVHISAKLGANVHLGANCYIGKNVTIGDGTTIYPNVTVMDDSTIGMGCTIWSGTVIRERTIIGHQCIFHTNVSIGSDGFGFRPSPDGRGLVKIPQIGNVVIGNGVEIGANSCVDRGKFSSTIIGDGTKIDNLVQIGHNSILGRSCIMAGHSGLAGSVTLGDGVIIGGSASIKDHTTLHSGVTVGAGSGVMGDVAAGKTVLGYPACDSRDMLKQWVALRKLGKGA